MYICERKKKRFSFYKLHYRRHIYYNYIGILRANREKQKTIGKTLASTI